MATALFLCFVTTFFACGDDEEEVDPAPPGSCEFEDCKVVCYYVSLPGENNDDIEIEHTLGSGLVDAEEEWCDNENLFHAFEREKLWKGDIDTACNSLQGYQDPDPETQIIFSCESTKYNS